jgi:hypothetical protein
MRSLLALLALTIASTGCNLSKPKGDDESSPAKDEPATSKPSSQATAQPTATAEPAVTAGATPVATSRGPCTRCATQEDFDKAQQSKSECCPVNACKTDNDCPGQRVCCRIPNGSLCGDASRCGEANRVVPKTPTNLACTSSAQCSTKTGHELCCKSGRRGEGRCMGLADGIKGCDTL